MSYTPNIFVYCRWCKQQFETSPYTPADFCSSGCRHAWIQRFDPDYYKRCERQRKWAEYLDDPWNYGVLLSQGWEP